MARAIVTAQPVSTPQQLTSVVKSARDVMRKDKGLSGELDRLPMLTWVMFLKFLDDMERLRETEARFGKKIVPAIEAPYRWRDWAAKPDGITGPELLAFINQDEAVRPDGTKGPGLFAYLRSLRGTDGGDRRDVIAAVFKGIVNRMINGYLLRDVVNKVNSIHFTSSDQVHTLGMFYESMLKEMRDAAGDSGEFYTPRPVVKFITTVVDPRLGETVLDPAAGTGGFLAAAFEHLRTQPHGVAEYERLQRETLFGVEAKPLPYLLCQMNLLLHGMEQPNIDPENALRVPLRDIGPKDRVDVIMTNPPFGGEEERRFLDNFPQDKRTSETALLFLQLIMRKLRHPAEGRRAGRCGMVVPDAVLFADGVCARIRKDLLGEYNLHTIVRLPRGVFAPYTDIQKNLLFFDKAGSTRQIWYYEHPLPPGRKQYTKTQALDFSEFKQCLDWWDNRVENERAWRVAVEEVEYSFNLDIRNPNKVTGLEHLTPERLVESISDRQSIISDRAKELAGLLASGPREGPWGMVPLREVLAHRKEFIRINDMETYKRCRVRLHGQGIVLRDTTPGARLKTKSQQVVRAGDFLVAEIDAKVGGFGVVPESLDGAIVSSHYFLFEIDESKLSRRFLDLYVRTARFRDQVSARGSTNYAAIRPAQVLEYQIPLLPLDDQERILGFADNAGVLRELLLETSAEIDALVPAVIERGLRARLHTNQAPPPPWVSNPSRA